LGPLGNRTAHGYEATREGAMAAFKSWRREQRKGMHERSLPCCETPNESSDNRDI